MFEVTHTTSENDDLLQKALTELELFCGFELQRKPSLFIINHWNTVDKLWYTNSRSNNIFGWINGDYVFVVSKELYTLSTKNWFPPKADTYYMLIKHELSHIFFQEMSGYYYKPTWLWEGFAIFASGQNTIKHKPTKFINFIDCYSKNTEELYSEAGFAVDCIIKKFGKDKLFSFIKSANLSTNYVDLEKLFREIFNEELNYANFNQWLSLNE